MPAPDNIPTAWSVNQLAKLTGKTREIIGKRLAGVPFETGAHNAKLYAPAVALERIYLGAMSEEEGGEEAVSEAESRRLLNIARRKSEELDQEIKRKRRIPLEDMEEINTEAFSNVAGMLKNSEGKTMTAEIISDMLAELRGIGAQMAELASA